MKSIRKAIDIFTSDEKKSGIFILSLAIVMSIIDSIGIASILPFLGVLGDPSIIQTNEFLRKFYDMTSIFFSFDTNSFVIFLGFLSFFFIIFASLYRALFLYLSNKFIELRRYSISSRILDKYLNQPYFFFLNNDLGELKKNILSEVDIYIGNIIRPLFNLFTYSFVLIAITILLVLVNPYLTFISILFLISSYTLYFYIFQKKLLKLGNNVVEFNKDRFLVIEDTFNDIKTLKLSNKEEYFSDIFKKPSKKFSTVQALNSTINQIPKYLIEGLAFGGLIAIVIFYLIKFENINGGLLGKVIPIVGVFAFSAYRLQPAIFSIYTGFAGLKYGKFVINNIYDILNKFEANNQKSSFDSYNLFNFKEKIEVKNLSFKYHESQKNFLYNLNFSIKKGSTIGIIGATGSGKTTLVDILLGLLQPSNGQILIDGVDIKNINIKSWQKIIGYVPQDIYLKNLSIAENIAFAIPKHLIDYKKLTKCSKQAQLDDFIQNELINKYDTRIGDLGARLSGGQRQRIGIARALYHNPDMIIFDEATSSLDALTENDVMNSILSLKNNKTILIIAHRVNTLKNCDKIIFLDKGLILDSGSYDYMKNNNQEFVNIISTFKNA